MKEHDDSGLSKFLGSLVGFTRRCLFCVLSFGPMPIHMAFIMDGNRRFSKIQKLKQESSHRAGFASLIAILQCCYEVGIKYVTVYAFSIDNFKREPEEVQSLMDLMHEKIEELLREDGIVRKYGVKVNFWGNLSLLPEPVRVSAVNAMARTSRNSGPVLSVCIAYSSSHDIVNAVQAACALNRGVNFEGPISTDDLEKHMYTRDCPDPDIVIRTSGETRLSNFLLWQTPCSHLQHPVALWPEFSLRHFVRAIVEYQKVYPYLEKRRSS